MGYDDDSFPFAENKKKRKKAEVNNSIIEFGDGESIDDTYYGYSIEDTSSVKPKNIRRRTFLITAAAVLLSMLPGLWTILLSRKPPRQA